MHRRFSCWSQQRSTPNHTTSTPSPTLLDSRTVAQRTTNPRKACAIMMTSCGDCWFEISRWCKKRDTQSSCNSSCVDRWKSQTCRHDLRTGSSNLFRKDVLYIFACSALRASLCVPRAKLPDIRVGKRALGLEAMDKNEGQTGQEKDEVQVLSCWLQRSLSERRLTSSLRCISRWANMEHIKARTSSTYSLVLHCTQVCAFHEQHSQIYAQERELSQVSGDVGLGAMDEKEGQTEREKDGVQGLSLGLQWSLSDRGEAPSLRRIVRWVNVEHIKASALASLESAWRVVPSSTSWQKDVEIKADKNVTGHRSKDIAKLEWCPLEQISTQLIKVLQ